MIFLFAICTLILNPYILLLINSSITSIRFSNIYGLFSIFYFLVFINLRNHGAFLYSNAFDDSDDYVIGAKRLIDYDLNIIDILKGKADPYLEHIDRGFAMLQLCLIKILPGESSQTIPIILSIIFALLVCFSCYSIPLITKNKLKLNYKILSSLVIVNPYLIYLNQHLFRQGLALSILFSISVPLFIRSFIKKSILKVSKYNILLLLFSLIIAFTIHRGSTIPLVLIFSTSIFFSSNFLNQVKLVFSKNVLSRKIIFILLLLIFAIALLNFSSKYYDQFLIFIDFKLRNNPIGLRTSILGLIISIYSLYICRVARLKIFFVEEFKTITLTLGTLNFIISLFCVLTPGGFVRVLFSTNFILLGINLITHDIPRQSFKYFTLFMWLLTYLFYVFLREGFWGRGNFLLPYFY